MASRKKKEISIGKKCDEKSQKKEDDNAKRSTAQEKNNKEVKLKGKKKTPCKKTNKCLEKKKGTNSSSQAAKSKFTKLTKEMTIYVKDRLEVIRTEEIASEIAGESLLKVDLDTLHESNWLNDKVINSYLQLITERSKQEGYPSVYAFSTFFYNSYKRKSYNHIKRWTKHINIFEFDINLVPINSGVHWCLCVFDHRSKSIKYYDSMEEYDENCLELLLAYICSEHMDKKKEKLKKKYTTEKMMDIPTQKNGFDCGPFMLKFAEFLTRDAELNFSQEDMPYFREEILYELLKGHLL